jgi:hypothetical protein
MNPTSDPSPSTRPGWTPCHPEHLPRPTFWPAGIALGITFLFWGILASWVILVVGIALFGVSLAGWISDLRHERKHHP